MPLLASLARALTDAGIPCEVSAPLRDCTTFRIGGSAAVLCRPQTDGQLVRALDIWRAGGGCPLFVLGRGSNVLFSDKGFPGLVICTRELRDVSFTRTEQGAPCLRAGCGTALAALSRRCAEHSPALSGLEFACGIPGTLGGAVVMNAGAHGGEMADTVRESVCISRTDGRILTLRGPEHEFSYRRSVYQRHPDWVLLNATLALTPADAATVRAVMERNLTARRNSQPLEYPNAGSVFRRPAQPGVYVGRLVEDCGLKGFRIGGAEVSEKHAGFIVNRGDATADDVRRLIAHVRASVLREYRVELTCEVCIVREDGRTEGE